MSDELLKIHPNGQWELISKARVLSIKQGGVQADIPQPDVGKRGKQGRLQVVAADPSPKPKPIRMQHAEEEDTSESIGPDRGGQNYKLFNPNGARIVSSISSKRKF